MYWKTDTIEIPDWDRHSLLDRLEPFDPTRSRDLSDEMVAYCRFYGLDLWVEHPDVAYHQGYVKACGHEVMVHYFRLPDQSTERGTVFILHGYFDHVGLYSQLIDRCLGAGFDVLAYDQPGHGLSSGTPAAIGAAVKAMIAHAFGGSSGHGAGSSGGGRHCGEV